jgi:hypothetical protein
LITSLRLPVFLGDHLHGRPSASGFFFVFILVAPEFALAEAARFLGFAEPSGY